ncbi:MAG: sugar ABC transporter substrate-binding protein [Actinobacteria bacterium]|nr:sugar ABC transporter substrate-binding protein [Actinomycetota bacterium]
MNAELLRGMTWDHPRGLDCLVASNSLLVEKHSVSVEWKARSLLAFGDQHIEEFYRDFDLMVIDHPHVPDAVNAGAVIAFEDLISSSDLEELSRTSVGPSHDSYEYRGKHWALAIDTASQVSAFRADKVDHAPIFWSDVIEQARKKVVLWPYKPVDAFSTFATLMAQKGHGLAEGSEYFDRESALEVLEFMLELASLVPDWCAKSNPIDIAEVLADSDDFSCAVALYGYSNYSRTGFRKKLVNYDDIPSFDGSARGSQLGGAGIAVSSASRNPQAAARAALALSLPEVQAGIYGMSAGQPGNLVAWKSHGLNAVTENFFANTLRTLEGSWVRPRVLGWPDVQFQTSLVIHQALQNRRVTNADVDSMLSMYEKFIRE